MKSLSLLAKYTLLTSRKHFLPLLCHVNYVSRKQCHDFGSSSVEQACLLKRRVSAKDRFLKYPLRLELDINRLVSSTACIVLIVPKTTAGSTCLHVIIMLVSLFCYSTSYCRTRNSHLLLLLCVHGRTNLAVQQLKTILTLISYEV